MTSGKTRRRVGESSSRGTRATSPRARTSRSSATPGSPSASDWASIKLRRPFVVWLKGEAARQGIFMGELVEELVTRALGGRVPWRRGGDR